MKKFITVVMALVSSIMFSSVVFAQSELVKKVEAKKEEVKKVEVKKEVVPSVPSVPSIPSVAKKEEVVKEEGKVVIGVIEQIDKDGNFITLKSEDKVLKVLCDADLIEEAYFESGDKVKLMVQDTKDGMQIIDYEYMYELEENYSGSEE